MKYKKAILSFALAALITMSSQTAFAEDILNPGNSVTNDAIEAKDYQPAVQLTENAYHFNTFEEARSYLMQCLADRLPTITFATSNYYTSQEIMDELRKHTGDPVGGDYFKWCYDVSNTFHKKDNGIHYYTIEIKYRTTYSQEMELTEKLERVMGELALDGLSDYQKVLAIYDYICKNVSYDDVQDDDDNLKYTAYGALVNGRAAGQGFSTLFYRMCLTAGVDARCVKGAAHMWNIVKIDGKYYNADTWMDSGRYGYICCLVSNASLKNDAYIRSEEYNTPEFNAAYPMSDTDYPHHINWNIDDNGILTVKGPGAIPSPSPWAGKSEIKEVILERVAAIDSSQFANCSGLRRVTADNNLKTIGSSAFRGCTALKSVELNSVEEIGTEAFYGCMSLPSITLPEGTRSIGYKAFADCFALREINLPDGIEKIDMYAFNNCHALENIVIPSGVKELSHSLFRECEGLKSVTLPAGIEKIGNSVFYKCEQLERISLPSSVKEMGDWVFGYCTKLKSITIPNGVTQIGEKCFYNCAELEKVYIPSSVNSIGENAFEYCKKLVIYGYPDSYAEYYAIDKDLKFVYIDSLPGDVNGDGNCDIEDLDAVLGCIKGTSSLSDAQLKAADCYGDDGKVDIRDYCAIYSLIY